MRNRTIKNDILSIKFFRGIRHLGNLFIRLSSTLVLCFFTFSTAGAKPAPRPASGTSSLSSVEVKPPDFSFSGKVTAVNLKSLVDRKDGAKKSFQEYLGIFDFNSEKYGTLEFIFDYHDDPNDYLGSGFNDTEVRFNFKNYDMIANKNWTFSFNPAIGSVLPTSKDSLKNLNMQGGGILDGSLSLTSNSGIFKQTYTTELEIYRYFHSNNTANDGSPLAQWLVAQTYSVKVGYKMVSLFATFIHFDTWSYDLTTDGGFKHKEGVEFTPWSFLALQLGHSNAGSIFRPDGSTSNIRLIDETSSLYFLKASFIF